MRPIEPSHVVRGQYNGYLNETGVRSDSDTETFIALKCEIDNWRWAGVPFFLRTGKRMAEGARIISIAFREPPKSMIPPGSGVGAHGPEPLLTNPPPVRSYAPGSWGPNSILQLIAPHAWRLPFERGWRQRAEI